MENELKVVDIFIGTTLRGSAKRIRPGDVYYAHEEKERQ